MEFEGKIGSIDDLEAFLSRPSQALIELMKRLKGDIMILGISGKIGVSLGLQAMSAIHAAGIDKKVYGVARFTEKKEREKLMSAGVIPITCDLMEREQVEALPKVENVIFMAGRKFGTNGSEEITWVMNVVVPALVAEHFKASRIVAFSTGCVYPMRAVEEGGCVEECPPAPIGEYSQSCLGRERIFEYYSKKNGTKLLLFRLNYSVDLRYGVLDDIGRAIWEGRMVNNSVGYFNAIWQGDVTANALRSLELADSPPVILNVTGPEIASVKETAQKMARMMGREVVFNGEAGKLNYLSDSGKMCQLFGKPSVSLEELIRMQADWISHGGISIGKPTHYEVNNGRF